MHNHFIDTTHPSALWKKGMRVECLVDCPGGHKWVSGMVVSIKDMEPSSYMPIVQEKKAPSSSSGKLIPVIDNELVARFVAHGKIRRKTG